MTTTARQVGRIDEQLDVRIALGERADRVKRVAGQSAVDHRHTIKHGVRRIADLSIGVTVHHQAALVLADRNAIQEQRRLTACGVESNTGRQAAIKHAVRRNAREAGVRQQGVQVVTRVVVGVQTVRVEVQRPARGHEVHTGQGVARRRDIRQRQRLDAVGHVQRDTVAGPTVIEAAVREETIKGDIVRKRRSDGIVGDLQVVAPVAIRGDVRSIDTHRALATRE